MTDQPGTPAAHAGDSTVPLVPDSGYRQPEVPPLEDPAWPDFSYDVPAGSASFDAEPTRDLGLAGAGTYPATAPLPTVPAAGPYAYAGPTSPTPYGVSSQTEALPSLGLSAGAAYQQPTVQPVPQRQPAYPGQQGFEPAYAPRPEPVRYETYQPYALPVPAPYAYPAPVSAAPEHPSAVTSLVLGVLGLFVLPILAPIAWAVAGKARREVRQYPGRWAPSGTLTAGYVLGILGTLAWGMLVAIIMVFMMIAVTSFG